MKDTDNVTQWVICIFSIIGAFVSCGIGGALLAGLFDVWELPIAGFCAAFAVVSMTYIAAPSNNRFFASFALVSGGVFAWLILEPSSYPESYEALAYQPTHMPLVSTLLGGVIAYLICIMPSIVFRKTKLTGSEAE
jgi:hypothetical protein